MNKYLLFAALLLCVVGCGKNVGMTGKVTFSDDGSPLTKGTICFQSATGLSRGQMNEDGTFVIGSFKKSDGLPKGDYVVYFSGAVEQDGVDASGMPKGKSLIDLKYTTPEDTPLKITVKGRQKIELQVERPETDTFMTPKL
ncbi:MAG: hypothetical protein IJM54_05745 [Thermoguttaceae bacterium]|nr:hypothetical protein [Thermoguttaceae bacterium]